MIFKAPAYKNEMITSQMNVSLKLFVPSDESSKRSLVEKYESEAIDFIYTPLGILSSTLTHFIRIFFFNLKIYFQVTNEPSNIYKRKLDEITEPDEWLSSNWIDENLFANLSS